MMAVAVQGGQICGQIPRGHSHVLPLRYFEFAPLPIDFRKKYSQRHAYRSVPLLLLQELYLYLHHAQESSEYQFRNSDVMKFQ